jgi:molybdopterin biosynthesis enzyme MoaB
MSDTSSAHKEKAPKTLGFAVFTCSTTRYYDHEAGKQVTDESGDLTVRILETNGHAVLSRALVPDNKTLIEANVTEAIKSNKIRRNWNRPVRRDHRNC